MVEEEKLQFPIQGATKCPKCGCKKRVGQQLIHEMKKEGKLGEKAFSKESLMLQVPLFDPTRPLLATNFTIPVLQILFDVCKKCGSIYCTEINLAQQPAQVQQMPGAKPFGFPQSESRWS